MNKKNYLIIAIICVGAMFGIMICDYVFIINDLIRNILLFICGFGTGFSLGRIFIKYLEEKFL